MSFDQFKVRPLQRLSASFWNSLMDALSSLESKSSEEILKRVKYEDLSNLAYNIIPDQANMRDLGSVDKPWNNIYAKSGSFSDSLTVQGKAVIKDGDPISVSDIFDTARDKITSAINNASITSKVDTLARELTLQSLLSKINVNLDTRASELTLQNMKSVLDKLQFDQNNLLMIKISDIANTLIIPVTVREIESRKAELYDADETVSQTLTLDTDGLGLITVVCNATTPTTFTVEISADGEHWFTYYMSTQAESSLILTVNSALRYVRVKSDAAGSSGDKVSLVIGAKL